MKGWKLLTLRDVFDRSSPSVYFLFFKVKSGVRSFSEFNAELCYWNVLEKRLAKKSEKYNTTKLDKKPKTWLYTYKKKESYE